MLEDLLKQSRVLYYFSEISRIPRGSGNMEAIGRFVYEKALSFGLEAMTDEFHNVVARVPATKGYENAPVVMLQGHLDMVAEKTPDSNHDFLHDPIELILEGDILHANKTTLGGDDGVAVAMMLAIMEDKSLEHPELECVFTVDEETGMNGAQGLDTSVLKAKYLVNMDNEYESDFIVSCAGGAGIMGILSVPQEDHIEVSGRKVLVTLSSELGGHSGTEIHRNRPNTNHLFGKLLRKLSDDGVCYHLVSINGGRLDNAICTHTEAVIVTNDSVDSEKIEAFLQADFVNSDDHPHVTFETVKEDTTMSAISDEKRDWLVETLLSLPNGVVSFSEDIEGLV